MNARQDSGGRIAAGVAGVVLVGGLIASAVTMTVIGSSSGGGDVNPVATIQVVDETYKIELATPDVLAIAEQLLAKETPPMIPNGLNVRDSPGPNAACAWHLEPCQLDGAQMRTAEGAGRPPCET